MAKDKGPSLMSLLKMGCLFVLSVSVPVMMYQQNAKLRTKSQLPFFDFDYGDEAGNSCKRELQEVKAELEVYKKLVLTYAKEHAPTPTPETKKEKREKEKEKKRKAKKEKGGDRKKPWWMPDFVNAEDYEEN
eukprot:TRINITY_DN113151_c0_g1_i1.p1 TRINITY_DN113151_c0_g1~~TRINITY_DN113151_c0_g1_i1.p1  ORF type:complete len:132 (+),score=17.74 TRINITY_DN113151_c0_g1_i1:25-420(+)